MNKNEDFKNKQLVELAYEVLKSKSAVFSNPYLEKQGLLEVVGESPTNCLSLLIGIPEYFNCEQKLFLVDCIAKDRETFKKYLEIKSMTLAVQSRIAKLVKDDVELSLLFAKTYINNWRTADIQEHVKKLKLTKEEKQQLIDSVTMAKLI